MRAVIAEDAVLLREGLSRLLDEGGFDVVDGVDDGEALLRSVEPTSPTSASSTSACRRRSATRASRPRW